MPQKILIIEDEEIISELLQKKLEKEGYEITRAGDGTEGLEKMRDALQAGHPPDLILLDIVMPQKGGFEVMEEMMENKGLKSIPVIVISNSGQPVELDRAKKLGAIDWLIKTEFDPQEVIKKVKKQIG